MILIQCFMNERTVTVSWVVAASFGGKTACLRKAPSNLKRLHLCRYIHTVVKPSLNRDLCVCVCVYCYKRISKFGKVFLLLYLIFPFAFKLPHSDYFSIVTACAQRHPSFCSFRSCTFAHQNISQYSYSVFRTIFP